MNKRLNDVAPSEWDRATKTGLEAWSQPDGYDTEQSSIDDCTTDLDWGEEDLVNHPTHYNSGGVECIQAIEASMELEAFQGYLKGNTLKYIWRMSYKGKALEDCEKAQWYLNKLISTLEDNT